MLDFLKTSGAKQKNARGAGGKQESKGSVTIDKFVFNVRDYNLKGFILDPYDKDILAKGMRFKFEIKVSKGQHAMEGRAEAVVTKIANGALAAQFTITPTPGN